jgi:hypothetical protein
MATTVARLEAVLGADTRAFDRAMDRSEGKTKSFGSHLGNLAKTAGVAAGVAGIGAVAYTLKTGLKEWTESTKVAAQTRAVIKSTGGVANVTAKQVSGLSTALMKKSGTDDEAIASGENLLLTFKNIRNEVGRGNDIFTQATKATLDLSVAFHKDMHSSAILVGKALNDPIKGLTALQAVKRAISNLFGKVIDWVKDVLGINSPSTVFHEMGRQSVQGFINGVGSMAGVLKKAVVGMVESLPSKALGAATGVIGAIPGAKGTIVGEGPKSGIHASPALAKQFAVTQMKAFGWGPSQMAALEPLWNGESGWRWNALKP